LLREKPLATSTCPLRIDELRRFEFRVEPQAEVVAQTGIGLAGQHEDLRDRSDRRTTEVRNPIRPELPGLELKAACFNYPLVGY
jgi:hypothetical protein